MLSRRRFLRSAGLVTGAALLGHRRVLAQPVTGTETFVLGPVDAFGTGTYLYLPFDVPAGVNRVGVKVESSTGAKLGAGLFDQRGIEYQTAGFRGVYGEERNELFVAAHEASQSFIPGPIEPGTWTVLVPVFQAPPGTKVTATVTLGFGPQQPAFVPGPEPGVVRDEPGWYRGDLHCHTPESSDAWKSESALTPAAWADTARTIGLDYLAMTDHNVVSQNFHLARDAGDGVLLMPGEEMTNWFHGHATVSGIEVGDWLDWRQRPLGVPVQAHESRIQAFLEVARGMGAYVSAAHPLAPLPGLPWDFFADAAVDAAALPDGLEVWTGQFQPDDEAALQRWDGLLREGHRVFANGGSDLHGTENTQGFAAGTPTTVVHAARLEKRAIVEALKRGRSFVTRLADGVEIYLSATGPENQAQIVGGTIYGEPTTAVHVEALVRKGGGMRLILWANGAPVSVTPLDADEQVVTADVPVGPAGGYVRAEVRGQPELDPTNPIAGRLDMEAFTNPIFLVNGPVPPGTRPESAPPPGGPPPEQQPPAPVASGGGRTLPATGGGALATAAAASAAAGAAGWTVARRAARSPGTPVRMTLTELTWRAGCDPSLADVTLTLVGEVVDGGVLRRWVPSCCTSHDRPVDVVLEPHEDLPGAGAWVELDGRWVPSTGTVHGESPHVVPLAVRLLAEPPPRREA